MAGMCNTRPQHKSLPITWTPHMTPNPPPPPPRGTSIVAFYDVIGFF